MTRLMRSPLLKAASDPGGRVWYHQMRRTNAAVRAVQATLVMLSEARFVAVSLKTSVAI